MYFIFASAGVLIELSWCVALVIERFSPQECCVAALSVLFVHTMLFFFFFACVCDLKHTKLFYHHVTMTVMKCLSTCSFLWLKKQLSKHNIVALNHVADDSKWQYCVNSLLQDPLEYSSSLTNTHAVWR